jgi:elongation factor Ts
MRLLCRSFVQCSARLSLRGRVANLSQNSDFLRVAPVPRRFASFSMESLKDLRVQSGAPIVECKKALQAAGDDLDAAMDWLREHGAAKASTKVQGRETTEGLVSMKVSDDGKSAALVKIASETDFAGRSTKFVDLMLNVVDAIFQSSEDGNLDNDTLLQATLGGKVVKDFVDEAIVAIRENLSVTNAVKLRSKDGILVGYIHNRVDGSDAGTAASIVELSGKDVTVDILLTTGKKLAMHVVAARPQYLSPERVPGEVLKKEKEILLKQMEGSGKPPEIMNKIAEGKLRKFYESVCLTEQGHMIEEKSPKVGNVLKDLGITLRRYEYLII